MLGGFDYLADQDIKGSKLFLNKLKNHLPGSSLVLDVGAGIGRVSKDLLLGFFDKTSLLECTESFIKIARETLPSNRIEKLFPVTMQEFQADPEDYQKYDLIWIQWVIIYASDGSIVLHETLLIFFRISCLVLTRMC